MVTILIIDDEEDIRELHSYNLKKEGYTVVTAENGELGLAAMRQNKPELILLDVMMPGMDGIEVCETIRQTPGFNQTLVCFLTARGEDYSQIAGLDAGADDYIVKPFRHPSELVARIRTRLRRSTLPSTGQVSIGDLKIDMVAHEVTRGGKKILLTRLEFELLAALAKEPGRVFTREALLSEVWGYHHSTDTRLVNVHVQRLRSKVELDADNPEIVLTVRGVGYRAGSTALK